MACKSWPPGKRALTLFLDTNDNLSRYRGIAAHGIHQASDLLNLDFHPVPGLHKERRGTFFPMPPGVPVRMTSPGESALKVLIYAMSSAIEYNMLPVLSCCTVWPFSRVVIFRFCGSGIASAVTSQGRSRPSLASFSAGKAGMLPVAHGAIHIAAVAGNIMQRLLLWYIASSTAHHQRHFAFIVKLIAAFRLEERCQMPGL
jgi:hypothetical protein